VPGRAGLMKMWLSPCRSCRQCLAEAWREI